MTGLIQANKHDILLQGINNEQLVQLVGTTNILSNLIYNSTIEILERHCTVKSRTVYSVFLCAHKTVMTLKVSKSMRFRSCI